MDYITCYLSHRGSVRLQKAPKLHSRDHRCSEIKNKNLVSGFSSGHTRRNRPVVNMGLEPLLSIKRKSKAGAWRHRGPGRDDLLAVLGLREGVYSHKILLISVFLNVYATVRTQDPYEGALTNKIWVQLSLYYMHKDNYSWSLWLIWMLQLRVIVFTAFEWSNMNQQMPWNHWDLYFRRGMWQILNSPQNRALGSNTVTLALPEINSVLPLCALSVFSVYIFL